MDIIDNISRTLQDDLAGTTQKGDKLSIASACFSIYAYETLKRQLNDIKELRFIFTSPAFISEKSPKEKREFYIPRLNRERSLYGTEFEVKLRNELTQKAIARECAEWIKSKVRFKSNITGRSINTFLDVQGDDRGFSYTPLNGFTTADLGCERGDSITNQVIKFSHQESRQFLETFNQIWDDQNLMQDVTAQVIDGITAAYTENAPEFVYFVAIYNIFSEFLADVSEDVLPNEATGFKDSAIWRTLFDFQKDAALAIINKLEKYNGCILADSVGLGKTFTALAVIKYYENRNKSVLVLCPKKLSQNWNTFKGNYLNNPIVTDRLRYDVLYHTDLNRTWGQSNGVDLGLLRWDNYDLVVIDESHNFRNGGQLSEENEKDNRYLRLLKQVIRKGVKTKVLMLSATPVNNRFTDLRNQLALAYEGDSELLSKKLKIGKSVEEIFRSAQTAFNNWAKLPPEERTARAILDSLDFDFFELLDSVTIARSRKHIQTFYDTKDIGQFPERRKPLSYHSPLTARTDVMGFNDIFAQLSLLKLAVYAPVSYILPSRLKKYEEAYDTKVGGKGTFKQADREKSLQALMTVNLLKRLESSVESFRLTLNALRRNHQATLAKITSFNQTGASASVGDRTEVLANLEGDDDELPIYDDDAAEIGGKVKINLGDMDLPSWERDLKGDLELIDTLLLSMNKITPEDDAKLQHLKAHLLEKISNPINPGNKKVLIFTAFADTADYLYANLAPVLEEAHGLHTAKVTGKGAPKSTLKKSYDFQELLTLFSPRSKEKTVVLPSEPAEVDLLIGTDCISEGQNLQDCDYLINYDIHWNPVRIIQRFGRVDRIGSLNNSIQLVNYWPDITLDEYINLKDRVESRMMIADVTATGDDNVLSAQANDVSYRKEQLRRLQEEVIELEDLKTGVSITDLGLNDFRMDLLNYVKENGELNNVPNGMHAVVPAQPALGLHPGVIFTLRNLNTGVNVNQHNRLHPYYLVYIDRFGHVVHDHTEVKRLLDLARTCCKGQDKPIQQATQLFNEETAEGRQMQAYSDLLGKAIHSMIEVKEENDLDSLFTGGNTTALTNTMSGLDDFELITFLVIQEAG